MTLVTSPPPPMIAPPLVPRRRSSALVVADEGCCDRAVAILGEALDSSSARVVIATLPMPLHPGVATFAPLSGLTTHARMDAESLERADRAARAAALDLPAALVSYCRLQRWSQVADLIADGRHVTYDLGGHAGTSDFADAIIDRLSTAPGATRA